MRTGTICLIVMTCGLVTCAQKKETRENMLVGTLTMSEVYKTCPRFRETAERYVPDNDVVEKLKAIDRHITYKVFLGTWCSDSEEHVPPFERIMTAAGNSHFEVEYYGLDREKHDGLGLAKRFNITHVPTFILLEDDKEIGRIVETPTVSIGEDVLKILEVEN